MSNADNKTTVVKQDKQGRWHDSDGKFVPPILQPATPPAKKT